MVNVGRLAGKQILVGLALFACVAAPIWAQGNDNYPSRPIKLIITWPVGGLPILLAVPLLRN